MNKFTFWATVIGGVVAGLILGPAIRKRKAEEEAFIVVTPTFVCDKFEYEKFEIEPFEIKPFEIEKFTL